MRIPLLILGNPSVEATRVRLSPGRYRFIYENVAAHETNLPDELTIEERMFQVIQVEISPDCKGRNINIFAERLDD